MEASCSGSAIRPDKPGPAKTGPHRAYIPRERTHYQREVLAMWDLMNEMASGIRGRMMPRRNGGLNTMTAMLIGASVGIAAWEAVRRAAIQPRQSEYAAKMAEDVMQQFVE
jgi:hypothetical protein